MPGVMIKLEDFDYFMEAVRRRNFADIKLRFKSSFINLKDQYSGMTALHWASCSNNMDTVNFLIEEGYDVDTETTFHNRPIHLAVYNGQASVVAELIFRGCSLTAKNKYGLTPLDVALFWKNEDCAVILRKAQEIAKTLNISEATEPIEGTLSHVIENLKEVTESYEFSQTLADSSLQQSRVIDFTYMDFERRQPQNDRENEESRIILDQKFSHVIENLKKVTESYEFPQTSTDSSLQDFRFIDLTDTDSNIETRVIDLTDADSERRQLQNDGECDESRMITADPKLKVSILKSSSRQNLGESSTSLEPKSKTVKFNTTVQCIPTTTTFTMLESMATTSSINTETNSYTIPEPMVTTSYTIFEPMHLTAYTVFEPNTTPSYTIFEPMATSSYAISETMRTSFHSIPTSTAPNSSEISEALSTNSSRISMTFGTNCSTISELLRTNSSRISEALGTNSSRRISEKLATNSSRIPEALGTNSSTISEALGTNSSTISELLGTNSSRISEALGTNSSTISEALGSISKPMKTTSSLVSEENVTAICEICVDGRRDCVLNCGHAFCWTCCKKIKYCSICRKLIRSRNPLYL